LFPRPLKGRLFKQVTGNLMRILDYLLDVLPEKCSI